MHTLISLMEIAVALMVVYVATCAMIGMSRDTAFSITGAYVVLWSGGMLAFIVASAQLVSGEELGRAMDLALLIMCGGFAGLLLVSRRHCLYPDCLGRKERDACAVCDRRGP